jgi:hypothetical protein
MTLHVYFNDRWLDLHVYFNDIWLYMCISTTDDFTYVFQPQITLQVLSIHIWIYEFVIRLTQRVSLVEQELLTLPEHPSSPPVISGVRVIRSFVLCVCFVDRSLYICTFSFGHCVVCSSIYGFWLPPFDILDLRLLITSLWYLRFTDSDYLPLVS